MKPIYFMAALAVFISWTGMVPAAIAQGMDHSMHGMTHDMPAAKQAEPKAVPANAHDHTTHAHQTKAAAKRAAQSPAEKELDEAMMRMHRDMAKPYTGDADADFIRGMIPHHAAAVDMARIELAYGDDPEARELARRIIVAQKGEIAWMRRWLEYRQIPESGAFRFNR